MSMFNRMKDYLQNSDEILCLYLRERIDLRIKYYIQLTYRDWYTYSKERKEKICKTIYNKLGRMYGYISNPELTSESLISHNEYVDMRIREQERKNNAV